MGSIHHFAVVPRWTRRRTLPTWAHEAASVAAPSSPTIVPEAIPPEALVPRSPEADRFRDVDSTPAPLPGAGTLIIRHLIGLRGPTAGRRQSPRTTALGRALTGAGVPERAGISNMGHSPEVPIAAPSCALSGHTLGDVGGVVARR
jgi:hypothetical protein